MMVSILQFIRRIDLQKACRFRRVSFYFHAKPARPKLKPMSEVLNELHRSQEVAYNLRDMARQCYVTRGKLCSKIIKYPHIEDYTVRRIQP